jgi:hypothetical protein
MDMRKTFATNAELEQDGIEVHFQNGAFIRLARAGGGNIRYEQAMKRCFQPYRRALNSGSLDNKTVNEILQKVYAETVVLGWRDFELDGAALDYSPETALKLFREFPEFWKIVQEESEKFANFKAEEINEAGKA